MKSDNESIAVQMSALVAQTDVGNVFKGVIENLMGYVGATSGSIFLIDGGSVSHHMLAESGAFPQVALYKMSQVMEKGLAGWAYTHKQGALCRDTHIDNRWVKLGDEEKFGSAIAIPLKSGEEIIGMLVLQHAERGYFDEHHLADVVDAARYAVPVIEFARVEELNKRLAKQTLMFLGSSPVPTIIMEKDWVKSANNAALQLLSMDSKESPTKQIAIGGVLDEMFEKYNQGKEGKSQSIEIDGKSFQTALQKLSGIGLLVQFHNQ